MWDAYGNSVMFWEDADVLKQLALINKSDTLEKQAHDLQNAIAHMNPIHYNPEICAELDRVLIQMTHIYNQQHHTNIELDGPTIFQQYVHLLELILGEKKYIKNQDMYP